MNPLDIPFNVKLMELDERRLAATRPVTSLDFYETVGGNLHEDGLFSVSIFGRMGDERRDRTFSYIDIRVPVFHPVIYTRLVKLKGLYREIMSGTRHARWDAQVKDFVPADELTGETGFAFFLEHWDKIEFPKNKSGIRDARIDLIEKYKKVALTDKVLVMPAGLRDIEVDENGRTSENEINNLYRRLLSISRTIAKGEQNSKSAALNLPRNMLQMTFNEIYDSIERLLTGKTGFVQKRWGQRRIFNGTRNVITALDTSAEVLGGKNTPKYTDTVWGLHQCSKALLPVTVHAMRSNYLATVFEPGNGKARLIDPTTLKGEIVELDSDTYDRWTTVEGLEKVISSYGEVSLRAKPIKLGGRYLALLYTGPDMTFKVFHDIDELPEGLDRKRVRPINLVELIYLSGYRIWNNYAGFVTRYPVTGLDSCYPTTFYVKTTVVGEMRRELGPDWQPLGEEFDALEFPTYEPLAYLDSLVIPASKLKGLGADLISRSSLG